MIIFNSTQAASGISEKCKKLLCSKMVLISKLDANLILAMLIVADYSSAWTLLFLQIN